MRMGIFLNHKRKIDKHNEQYAEGLVSYKMTLYEHSDLTLDEFFAHKSTLSVPEFEALSSFITRTNSHLIVVNE